jgi:hypothetical protein
MYHNHRSGFAHFMSFFGVEVGKIDFKGLGDHDSSSVTSSRASKSSKASLELL